MFHKKSLCSILTEIGFKDVAQLPNLPQDLTDFDSWMIEKGIDPRVTDRSVVPESERPVKRSVLDPRNLYSDDAEFLTMVGTKPS